MTTETKNGEGAAAAAATAEADDFDAAFAEAIREADSGEPAKKPEEKAADEKGAAATGEEGDDEGTAAAATDDAAKKAAEEKTAADKKAADEKAAADAKAAEEKAAADKKAADDAAAAADPAAKKAADEEAAKKAAEESARKLAEDAARKLAEESAAKKAAEEKAAADKKAADEAAAAAEIKDPVLSDEHKKALDAFQKEWPDVAAAVDVKVAHVTAQIEARFARALTAIVGKVYEDMAPLAQSYVNVETNSFRTAILGAHKDYDDVYPKLEGWIASQPAYLAEAYKRVYNGGNAQEVIDLVSRFKEATGVKSQAPDTAPKNTSPASDAKAEAAKKAAADLAPVSGKRSTPTPNGADPNDFDGAFAEAAAQLSR